MKHARTVNNTAVDVRSDSPEGIFTPNIVAEFVQVPDTVEDGWMLDGGTWSAPPPIVPHVPTPAEIAALLADHKAAKRLEIYDEVQKYLDQDAIIAGSPMSVSKAIPLIGHANRNPHEIRNVTTKTGSLSLDATAIDSINTLIDTRGTAIEDNGKVLNLLVNAATTTEEVSDIDVSVGWP